MVESICQHDLLCNQTSSTNWLLLKMEKDEQRQRTLRGRQQEARGTEQATHREVWLEHGKSSRDVQNGPKQGMVCEGRREQELAELTGRDWRFCGLPIDFALQSLSFQRQDQIRALHGLSSQLLCTDLGFIPFLSASVVLFILRGCWNKYCTLPLKWW